MRRNFRFGRLLYVSCVLLVLGSGLWVIDAQQKQNSNFTGNITRLEDTSKPAIAHIRFDAGARTKWHSHENGQIILVEEGVARTQVKGGQVIELRAGETTYAPPGAVHWHGASPDQSGVQYNVTRGAVTWLGEVTDAEYKAAPKR